MGRRRRKVIKIMRRKLPKVFTCPQCGMTSIRVIVHPEGSTKIACGSCGLVWEKTTIKKMEAIDIYNKFIDEFMVGKG